MAAGLSRQRPRARVRGSQVAGVLLLAALATAVVPPAGAWWLNAWRVEETTARARAAVSRVTPGPPGTVARGPGRISAASARGAGEVHEWWVSTAMMTPGAFAEDMVPDAWGLSFLLTDRWLLSAGPNGIVETPFDADVTRGDDIGVRLR